MKKNTPRSQKQGALLSIPRNEDEPVPLMQRCHVPTHTHIYTTCQKRSHSLPSSLTGILRSRSNFSICRPDEFAISGLPIKLINRTKVQGPARSRGLSSQSVAMHLQLCHALNRLSSIRQPYRAPGASKPKTKSSSMGRKFVPSRSSLNVRCHVYYLFCVFCISIISNDSPILLDRLMLGVAIVDSLCLAFRLLLAAADGILPR